MKEKQNYLYDLVSTLDKSLVQISDSEFGKPIGFYRNKKFYTTKFLEEILHIHFIKKNCVETKKIKGNISKIIDGELKSERYSG